MKVSRWLGEPQYKGVGFLLGLLVNGCFGLHFIQGELEAGGVFENKNRTLPLVVELFENGIHDWHNYFKE